MKCRRESRPEIRRWKRFGRKHGENPLGVALIQPGCFRYKQKKVADFDIWNLQEGWNRVLKQIRPLQGEIARGFFCTHKAVLFCCMQGGLRMEKR